MGWKSGEQAITAEILRTQISELKKKKTNLQSEISTFYRSHKNKLDLEHNMLIDKHEKEYRGRVHKLDNRETAIKKGETSLESQRVTTEASTKAILQSAEGKKQELDTLISKNNKKIKAIEIEYEGKKDTLDRKSEDIISERESIKENEKALKGAQDSITVLQKHNEEESARLSILIRDYEGKINYVDLLKSELKTEKEDINKRKSIIAENELDITYRLNNAKKSEEEANMSLGKANETLAETGKIEKENSIEADRLSKLSDAQSGERRILDEKEISLREKDRFLILKERIINGKIRILKELRKKQG